MLDVHWAFLAAEAGSPWRCDPTIDELPATAELLLAGMDALPPPWADQTEPSGSRWDALLLDRLNVIVRRYGPGQRLKWHKDSIGLFDEPVYGVVLQAAEGCHGLGQGSLEFKQGGDRYVMHETRGLVHIQTGAARYEWAHGVPSDGPGRITVTWRWFRRTHARWAAQSVCRGPGNHKPLRRAARARWVANFLAAACQGSLRPALATAFLLALAEPRDAEVPWIFNSKNDACGPQMTASKVWHAQCRASKRQMNSQNSAHMVKAMERCSQHLEAARNADEAACRGRRNPGGLDARVLPLLRIWEAVEPTEDVNGTIDKDTAEGSDSEEDEDDPQMAEERRLMQSLGLPVTFQGGAEKHEASPAVGDVSASSAQSQVDNVCGPPAKRARTE